MFLLMFLSSEDAEIYNRTPKNPTMANEIGFFELNTGAKIPSVGLGTWQADPGVVGDAVAAAVKVRL